MDASRGRVWLAIRTVDLGRSALIRMLFTLRGMTTAARSGARQAGGDPHQRMDLTLDGLQAAGFSLLAERPEEEIVLGLVGTFWRPAGGIRRVPSSEWAVFDEPGWAKAAWSFRLDEAGSDRSILLSTETRVRCTDEASRRAFLRYWRVIRPFSGLIRREALRLFRADAQASRSRA